MKLVKLITSDFGLPVTLLLLAVVVGAVESGFANMLNGISTVLLTLGVASFVTSIAVIFSKKEENRLFIYIFLFSSILIFATSFYLYINGHGKLIVIASTPGVVLGVLIAFLSRKN